MNFASLIPRKNTTTLNFHASPFFIHYTTENPPRMLIEKNSLHRVLLVLNNKYNKYIKKKLKEQWSALNLSLCSHNFRKIIALLFVILLPITLHVSITIVTFLLSTIKQLLACFVALSTYSLIKI